MLKQTHRLIVLVSPSAEGNEEIQSVLQRLQPARTLTARDEPATYEELSRCAAVVVPMMSVPFAVKTALGIADSIAVAVVLKALAVGKPVFACAHDVDPTHEGAFLFGLARRVPQLSRLMQNYLQVLESYGIQLINPDGLAAAVSGHLSAPQPPTPNHQPLDLVTLADVERAALNDRKVILAPKAIVTPWARERAKELGVELIQVS
ncbi:MAG: hypothetical protein NZT92_03265 [Abditibacteriales bacterium]|nr:hypothetical protein [Abditibacteriales bacterium]MDW8364918.1 hypothetical protein [Abditibacteriales bacterium]